MDKCRECGGLGVIERDSKTFECMCAFIKRMASSMPSYIRRADLKKDHLSLSLLKNIRKHVLVIASWQDMKAVIKAAIISNPNYFIKITSDREIRDVYVGSKSKAARGDEDGAIYNSLEDLMDPPSLMIVRLNELSYKNKAAPGALEEAISYRVDRDKPTWLYSDVDKPFTVGSHAYSDSVADLIKSSFPISRVERILTNVAHFEDDDLLPQPIQHLPVIEHQAISEPIVEAEVPPHKTNHPGEDTTTRTKSEITNPVRNKIRPAPDNDADIRTYGLSKFGSGIQPSKSKFRGNKRS